MSTPGTPGMSEHFDMEPHRPPNNKVGRCNSELSGVPFWELLLAVT